MKLTKRQANQIAILLTWYMRELEHFDAAIRNQNFEYAAKLRDELGKRIQNDFKRIK